MEHGRAIVVVAAIAALVGLAVAVWHVAKPRAPRTFTSLRQSRVQDVPGTFGLTLSPPPTGFDPAISPQRALGIASQGRKAPGAVYITLASVPGMYTGTTADMPMWLIVVRNLCYPSQKGELVSSSRRAPKDRVSNCSVRNLWVQILNPRTGVRLSVVSGFDPTASWAPATGTG